VDVVPGRTVAVRVPALGALTVFDAQALSEEGFKANPRSPRPARHRRFVRRHVEDAASESLVYDSMFSARWSCALRPRTARHINDESSPAEGICRADRSGVADVIGWCRR
jgi:hypothetical protein